MRTMKNDERLYLDIHVLQTVPPSCVNRDDTGSPKTAVYGGVNRARVSSQSWKRAMRQLFNETLPQDKLGVRTKRIVDLVAQAIDSIEPREEAGKLAESILKTAGLTIASEKDGTGALFFMSRTQAEALARLALENEKPNKAQAVKAIKDSPGIDVVLFGRMVATDPSLNTDAAAQVAHSLSTHKVTNEYDYFTAVDDMSPEDNVGAGHIGTVEFNSSTLYRYATLAVHELDKQLPDLAALAARAFVDAFVRAMPTGKQNTFANRTLPDAVMVCLRKDQPVNLVGAFEKPVKASDQGYAAESVQRLASHAQQVYEDFVETPFQTFVTGRGLEELGEKMPLSVMLDAIRSTIETQLSAQGDEA